MYFVVMTRQNVASSMAIEVVTRISHLIRDYCGVLSEELIRKNLVLIYELLDEVMDYGYPQTTSTEQLKSYVLDEPATIGKAHSSSQYSNTAHSTAALKSVLQSGEGASKNETFVDLFEQLTVLFGIHGELLRAEIEGQVKMRCYIPGSPLLHMGFNEDLTIKNEEFSSNRISSIKFDDVSFHKNVSLERWNQDRSIFFHPPEGEFNLMVYRMECMNFPMPFKITPKFTMIGSELADLIINLEANLPDPYYGSHITISVPLPQATISASFSFDVDDLDYEKAEFKKDDKVVVWTISKLRGGFSSFIHIKMVLQTPLHTHFKKEMGPISLSFEIPMLLLSGLQVKFLKVSEKGHSFTTERWIRGATTSNSYVSRVQI